MTQEPFISATCKGERCSCCGAPAVRKVGEEIPYDDPLRNRHNLTAYVCARHFAQLFGATAARQVRYTTHESLFDVTANVETRAKNAFEVLNQQHFSVWERDGFKRAGALVSAEEQALVYSALWALHSALREAASILYSAGDQLALLNKNGGDNPWSREIADFLTLHEITPKC